MKRSRFALHAFAALWIASAARAQDSAEPPDVQAAARAFQAAQRAQLEGSPEDAARLYELADSIAPSPEALRSAIRSHVEAGAHARAATLALAAQRRYPDDADALALSSEVLIQHAPALGRLRVRCDQPCALSCDGQALGTEPVQDLELFVQPGVHALEARFDQGHALPQSIELAAGELRELALTAPPAPPPHSEPAPAPLGVQPETRAAPVSAPARATAQSAGLPQAVFWSVAGLTLAGAGLTLWSGLDMADKHDRYVQNPTRAGYDRGKASEVRTNVLLGSTAALLAATSALLFFTAWDDGEETLSPSLAATHESAVLSLRRRFQ